MLLCVRNIWCDLSEILLLKFASVFSTRCVAEPLLMRHPVMYFQMVLRHYLWDVLVILWWVALSCEVQFGPLIVCICVVCLQLVLSSLVPVVEPLLCGETSDQLSSVETELVLVTLRRFDESVAPSLTLTGREMKMLINAIKSRRRIVTTDNSLSSAAIAQVSTMPCSEHCC